MKDLECLQRAVDYIEEHLGDEISIQDVSRYSYLSERNLSGLFRSIAGYPLLEYIRKRRLSLSSSKLLLTEDKIIDIGIKYGYQTPESFSRAFKSFQGISPKEYRKRKQKGEELNRIQFINNNQIINEFGNSYRVLENCPIYYTNDMDLIASWFHDVLGWISNIDLRNEKKGGIFGCVMPITEQNVSNKLNPFMGFSLFYGVPLKRVIGYITVDDIFSLRKLILHNGWNNVSEIAFKPWGAQEFSVTTPDGGIIRFCSYEKKDNS